MKEQIKLTYENRKKLTITQNYRILAVVYFNKWQCQKHFNLIFKNITVTFGRTDVEFRHFKEILKKNIFCMASAIESAKFTL